MISSSALKIRGCVFGIRTRPARVPFSRLGRVHRYPWGRRQRKAIGGISITTYSVAFASSCHPWRRTAPGWRIRADPARRAPGQGRRARWPGAVARPRLPRIRTCPIRTSDSSGRGFAAKRRASRFAPLARTILKGRSCPGVYAEDFEVYAVRKVWRKLRRVGGAAARCTVARRIRRWGGKARRRRVEDRARWVTEHPSNRTDDVLLPRTDYLLLTAPDSRIEPGGQGLVRSRFRTFAAAGGDE